MIEFSKPQPFNVEIGAPEIADENASRVMPLPPVLFRVRGRSLVQTPMPCSVT